MIEVTCRTASIKVTLHCSELGFNDDLLADFLVLAEIIGWSGSGFTFFALWLDVDLCLRPLERCFEDFPGNSWPVSLRLALEPVLGFG